MSRQARQRVVLAIVTLVLGACGGTPAAFPIRTDPAARSLLTGEWSGSYSGGPGGRSGSISFILQAGDSAFTTKDGEHAHGDVLMIPSGQGEPLQPVDPRDPERPGPQVLTIEFVRAQGNRITGTLKPYHDPTCSCTVSTTFVGEITGDVIKGTFTAHPPAGDPQTGEWEIERKKKP